MRNFPHNPDHKILVELLRGLRLERSLLQTQVAEKLNRPQSYVAKYENCERRLDFMDVYYIAEALEISFIDLCKTFEKKRTQKSLKNDNKRGQSI